MIGHIDHVGQNIVSGWASYSYNSPPAMVGLYVDHTLIQIIEANLPRPGLVEKGIHHTGNCGFRFILTQPLIAKHKYVIEVKLYVESKEIALSNSPFQFHSATYNHELIKSFQPNTFRKVLIVGLPKSGTSILTYSIADAVSNPEIHFEPQGINGLRDISCHHQICSRMNPSVTKCLFFSRTSTLINEISHFYDKRIWISRDPRDWLISCFLYTWYHEHKMPKEKFNLALNRLKSKEFTPNKVDFIELLRLANSLEHFITELNGTITNLAKLSKSEWHFLRYEDFVQNELTELEQYLGFTVSPQSQVPKNLARVVRSKTSGNWRNWFTKNDVDFLKPKLDEHLCALGYDPTDWRLNKFQQLDPEIGSKYMRNLYLGKLS